MKLLGLLCLSAVATASELCIPIGQLANLGQQAEKLFNYGNEIEINETHIEYAPTVQTKYGQVQGRVSNIFNDSKTYYSYRKIPFAKPPVGLLRFKEPQPPDPWSGILQALQFPPLCLQLNPPSSYLGEEDCLYLNIHTPNKITGSLPVMFWIHGGAWISGKTDGFYKRPDLMIEEDVIVVTFNYRLGPLGFLSTYTMDLPGNIGLKDQIMALRWVKENIENFGGDPNRITLFGQSAGGASVHFLYLSPLTKGLFQNAIVQSGSTLAQWAITFKHRDTFDRLAYHAGCRDRNLTSVIKCLQETNITDIIKAAYGISQIFSMSMLTGFPYNPNVEPNHPGAVIKKLPFEILADGDYDSKPIILGYNSREGLVFYPNYYCIRILVATQQLVPEGLKEYLDFLQGLQTNWDIRNVYYSDGITPDRGQIIDLLSDITFVNPILQAARMHAKVMPNATYLYTFSYEGPTLLRQFLEVVDSNGKTVAWGIPHGDELAYEWRPQEMTTKEAKYVSKHFVKYFTNFAKTGIPADNLNDWSPIHSSSLDQMNALDFNFPIKKIVAPHLDKATFWDGLYKKYGKPPYKSF